MWSSPFARKYLGLRTNQPSPTVMFCDGPIDTGAPASIGVAKHIGSSAQDSNRLCVRQIKKSKGAKQMITRSKIAVLCSGKVNLWVTVSEETEN